MWHYKMQLFSCICTSLVLMYMYVAHNYLKGLNILISLHLFCAIHQHFPNVCVSKPVSLTE